MQYASHQQTNRYAVVGDMAIRFYLILLKRNRALSRTRNRVSYASVFLETHGVLILTRYRRFLRFIVTHAYVALFRSWHAFIPKHFMNVALLCCRNRGGRNGLPIRCEQIEKG